MYDYCEVCPISKATALLCERWTFQIIREMLMGATRFSEFQTFLPKLSPTLLNTRLKTLEENGILIRRKIPEKKGYQYHLTPAGKALEPVLHELGKWGMNWVFTGMNDDQLNTSVIVRDFASALDTGHLPSGNSTLQLNVTGEEGQQTKFILVRDNKTEVCDDNIGHDVDVYLTAELKTFYDLWFGEVSLGSALDNGRLKVVGSPIYTDNLTKWLCVSQFASQNRSPK